MRWIPDLYSLPRPRTRARVNLWRELTGNTALLQTSAYRVQTLCPRPPLPGCPSGTVPQRSRDRSPLVCSRAAAASQSLRKPPRLSALRGHPPPTLGGSSSSSTFHTFPGAWGPVFKPPPPSPAESGRYVGHRRVLHPISSLTSLSPKSRAPGLQREDVAERGRSGLRIPPWAPLTGGLSSLGVRSPPGTRVQPPSLCASPQLRAWPRPSSSLRRLPDPKRLPYPSNLQPPANAAFTGPIMSLWVQVGGR